MDYLVSINAIPHLRINKRIIRFSRRRLEEWFAKNEGRPYVKPKSKGNGEGEDHDS